MSVVWHDLECGGYVEDLDVWAELAAETGGQVLDVGAGTGRVTLELARAGFAVTALDLDGELLDELRRRAAAAGLDVTTVVADARAFTLDMRFPLCIVPMQTIQLLGGSEGRTSFLRAARHHLTSGGRLAIALADELDLFDATDATAGLGPLPDVTERDGVVYSSRAVAVRRDNDGDGDGTGGGAGFVLERVRETVTAAGEHSAEQNLIHLDGLEAPTLEREAADCGLRPAERIEIPATDEYVGSTVVVLHA